MISPGSPIINPSRGYFGVGFMRKGVFFHVCSLVFMREDKRRGLKERGYISDHDVGDSNGLLPTIWVRIASEGSHWYDSSEDDDRWLRFKVWRTVPIVSTYSARLANTVEALYADFKGGYLGPRMFFARRAAWRYNPEASHVYAPISSNLSDESNLETVSSIQEFVVRTNSDVSITVYGSSYVLDGSVYRFQIDVVDVSVPDRDRAKGAINVFQIDIRFVSSIERK